MSKFIVDDIKPLMGSVMMQLKNNSTCNEESRYLQEFVQVLYEIETETSSIKVCK